MSKDTEVEASGSLLERSRWCMLPLLAPFPLEEGEDDDG